nr:BLOC-1-related complex subunit 7 isoform X2 [Pelodiscus sinensis]|eukprot:XP_014427884.1 BLOC-1-related complex subunit 7 isoform X2 [Pelodiscus sinensis]
MPDFEPKEDGYNYHSSPVPTRSYSEERPAVVQSAGPAESPSEMKRENCGAQRTSPELMGRDRLTGAATERRCPTPCILWFQHSSDKFTLLTPKV